MNIVIDLVSPRQLEADKELVAILPSCVQQAAEVVGQSGVVAFFAGYIESLDDQRAAA